MHVAVAFLLPWPFSGIHVIFISFIMILFLYEHGSVVWFAAILGIMLDFISGFPFGVAMVGCAWAATCMLLLYRHVFTNRSLLAAIGLLSIGYLVYRSVYIGIIVMQRLVESNQISLVRMSTIYVTEVLMTIGMLCIVYTITAKMSYQLQHTSIQESWFRTLRKE